tara:strand:- start:407 stop:526 length:120 start_codon:yes stop_codon:yes gene_type:complete
VVELAEQDKTDNQAQMVEMVEQEQINHQYIQQQLLEYLE